MTRQADSLARNVSEETFRCMKASSCLGEVKSTLYSRFCNRKPCIRHTAYTSRRPTCRAAGGQSGSSTALARATSVQLRSLDWLPICSHYSIKALGKALRKKETLGQSGGVVDRGSYPGPGWRERRLAGRSPLLGMGCGAYLSSSSTRVDRAGARTPRDGAGI